MRTVLTLGLALFAFPAAAQGFRGTGLDELAPLVGKTWVGEDLSPSGERTVSVEQWEWILGGKAVRVTQSVNDGELGMQYTYFVDPMTHKLSFHAISTTGPYSKGDITIDNGKLIRNEMVIGSAPLNMVKVTFVLSEDGTMTSSSEYYKGSHRIAGGHDYHYHVVPDAKTIFRSDQK